MTAKKWTKKRNARVKLLFCQSKPIAFCRPRCCRRRRCLSFLLLLTVTDVSTTCTVVTVPSEPNILQHSSETFSISVTNGIYLERWDRIDYKRVKFLVMDPRYPRLPSKTICLPEFQQPQRWADYFGARARTYFVPQQTGIYYFMLCKDILIFKLLTLSCLTGFKKFAFEPENWLLGPVHPSKGEIWKSKANLKIIT